MFKKRNRIFVAAALLIFLGILYLAGVLIGFFRVPEFLIKEKKLNSVEAAVKTMKESFPTDVVILGETINFEYEFPVRYVEEINEKTVGLKGEYQYQAIIINDLNGGIYLQDSEIAYLDQLIHLDGYVLLYLGEKYSSAWEEETDHNVTVEGNLSSIFYKYGSGVKECIGSWKKSDLEEAERYPFLLGEVIIYDIEDYLEEVNKAETMGQTV